MPPSLHTHFHWTILSNTAVNHSNRTVNQSNRTIALHKAALVT